MRKLTLILFTNAILLTTSLPAALNLLFDFSAIDAIDDDPSNGQIDLEVGETFFVDIVVENTGKSPVALPNLSVEFLSTYQEFGIEPPVVSLGEDPNIEDSIVYSGGPIYSDGFAPVGVDLNTLAGAQVLPSDSIVIASVQFELTSPGTDTITFQLDPADGEATLSNSYGNFDSAGSFDIVATVPEPATFGLIATICLSLVTRRKC